MAKQNCSTLLWSYKEVERGSEFVPRIPAELLFRVFQDLNNEHLRFHQLVWLHKQLSSTTILVATCWPSVPDERVENRFSKLRSDCPVQPHHIIQLSMRFWMQHIQITCYRIQKRDGTESLCYRAPVQGLSPMSLSCTPVPITSNELNPVLLQLLSSKHKPKACINVVQGIPQIKEHIHFTCGCLGCIFTSDSILRTNISA